MNTRQWAALLDDDGVDDTALDDEIQSLQRSFLSTGANGAAPAGAAPAGAASNLAASPSTPVRNQSRSLDVSENPPASAGEGEGSEADDVDADNADEAEAVDLADLPEDPLVDACTREPLRDLSELAVWTVSTAKPGNGVERLLDPSPKTFWQSDGPQPHTISAQFACKVKVSEVRLRLWFKEDESYTPAIISVLVGSSFHDLRVVRRNKEVVRPTGWLRIPLGKESVAALGDEDDTSSIPSQDDDMETMSAGDLAERDQRRIVRADHRRRSAQVKRGLKEVAPPMTTSASRGGEMEVVAAAERYRRERRDVRFVRAHMVQVVIHTNHQNGRDSHVRQVKVLGPTRQVGQRDSVEFSSTAFQMFATIR